MPHNTFVWLFLLLALAGLVAWAVIALRRSPYTLAEAMLLLFAMFFARVMWRGQVPERLPLEPNQGAVIVSNHRSSIDPFFVQMAAHRRVHWMVAREYCEHPLMGIFLRACQVIPVGRGGVDTAAMKAAIRKVKSGGLVGMFPEGRINVSDKFMLPCRPGAVLVALKARASIVPCYIEGSPYGGSAISPFFMRARTKVLFGSPIDLSNYFDQDNSSEIVAKILYQCVRAIAELAGHPDFEPELAGRRWMPDLEGTTTPDATG